MSLSDYPRPWRVDGSIVLAANGRIVGTIIDAELSEVVVHTVNWTEGVRDAAPAPGDLLPFDELRKMRDEYCEIRRNTDAINLAVKLTARISGGGRHFDVSADHAIRSAILQTLTAQANALAARAAMYDIDIATPEAKEAPDA